jgi:pimeloyl-ACP methyl ester carboxylesterase
MPQVEGAGVALHYEERGEGSGVLVIHGMASGAAQWSAALDELAAAGARAVVFDRRGYGASGAPEPYAATTVQEQSQDAAAVIDALGLAPALLVGEGLGALVALELLVRRPELATAAVLVEPPLFAYVPEATEALAAERQALEEALREGGPEAAVGADYKGYFADYAGLASWSPSRSELRSIEVPVAVLTRQDSAPHVVAAADAGAALMPRAQRLDDGDAVNAASSLL